MRAPLIFSYLEPVYFCNFVLIFMPLWAKKCLKNLGNYATTNLRKNTIYKMKSLLKLLVLGKGNKAQRSVLFSLLPCHHLKIEANMVAALDAVTVDDMRRWNFLFFIITLYMNLKLSLLGSCNVLNDSLMFIIMVWQDLKMHGQIKHTVDIIHYLQLSWSIWRRLICDNLAYYCFTILINQLE